jgi:hypothetical protein
MDAAFTEPQKRGHRYVWFAAPYDVTVVTVVTDFNHYDHH